LSLEAIETLSADYLGEPPRRIGFLGGEPEGSAPRVPFGEVARGILDIFEHDGYLRKEGEHYVFVSGLVKDWWRARFEFGFVAAARRRTRR
jgi:hypothetical protein